MTILTREGRRGCIRPEYSMTRPRMSEHDQLIAEGKETRTGENYSA